MEFLPGAFEREWEQRRAALLHDLQMGQTTELDWEWPRRGGVARLPGEGSNASTGFRRARGRNGGTLSFGRGGAGRPMRARFEALARGSQPAVVKLASYGGGARAAAMMSYASREGELAVENEAGERIAGRAALTDVRADWEHLFDSRAASRDIGIFQVTISGTALAGDHGQDEAVRELLRTGFGDRRIVYAVEQRADREIEVHGVLVLRDKDGERLTGDAKATAIVQQRFDETETGRDMDVRFRFHGYGNGLRFGTARVRDLMERSDGKVHDETGRAIETPDQAGDLVQKEWRKELHSRRGRDVMHLIVSARAGTDLTAFQNAVRDFLGEQFAGHRYVFAMHDPADDPKELGKGGKRPHIHVHAIVTMRSEMGGRIETSPKVFREWRSLMAEKAREHGIDMELTDRREFASPPAYTRNQVRPVSYAGRTEHEGTSEAAQARYVAKRSNRHTFASASRSREYATEAREIWQELARSESHDGIAGYAAGQVGRIRIASQKLEGLREFEASATEQRSNMVMLTALNGIEEGHVREMTRPEFEAYEKRVEGLLSDVEKSIKAWERKDFDEVAAAAREVVSIRRDYLEFVEQQAEGQRDGRGPIDNELWDRSIAKHGEAVVEQGNDVMIEIEAARTSIKLAPEAGRDMTSAQADLRRELEGAARLAVEGNGYLREVAETDRALHLTIKAIELTDERDRAEGHRRDPGSEDVSAATSHHGTSHQLRASYAKSGPSGAKSEQVRDVAPVDRHKGDGELDHSLESQRGLASAQDERKPASRQQEIGDTVRSVKQGSARSDPPQQHVPRLRELEREVEERHGSERDERER